MVLNGRHDSKAMFLQIQWKALETSSVGSIPMHFRHLFLYAKSDHYALLTRPETHIFGLFSYGDKWTL